MSAPKDQIEAFLATYPPAMQAVTQTLRALVTRPMPRAVEVLYARHNHIGYSLTGKMREGIIYICPLKDYVRLGFMYGGQLTDPTHLLQGEGKRMRHVKVRTLEAANTPALEQLIVASWAAAQQPAVKTTRHEPS